MRMMISEVYLFTPKISGRAWLRPSSSEVDPSQSTWPRHSLVGTGSSR